MTGTSRITQSIDLLTVPKFVQQISIKICQIPFSFCSIPAQLSSVQCGNYACQIINKSLLANRIISFVDYEL